jgi:hypothetical protein
VFLKAGIEVTPLRRIGSWPGPRSLLQVEVVGTRQTMVVEEGLALEERP